MSKKKNKFDLTYLVHGGYLKENQNLCYVTDPTKICKIVKQPNGEFKVQQGANTMTVHAFAQQCLGQEPPDHASKWLRTEDGQILFDIWHAERDAEAA